MPSLVNTGWRRLLAVATPNPNHNPNPTSLPKAGVAFLQLHEKSLLQTNDPSEFTIELKARYGALPSLAAEFTIELKARYGALPSLAAEFTIELKARCGALPSLAAEFTIELMVRYGARFSTAIYIEGFTPLLR
jgi:hypothetical protein